MWKRIQSVLTIAALAAMCSAQVVDRVIAVVHGHAILQSEWEDTLHVEQLMAGRAGAPADAEEQRHALDHLLEQALVQHEMAQQPGAPMSAAELDARVQQLKADLGVNAPAQWKELLDRAELSESDVRSAIRVQLALVRFIDTRFRPNVRVDRFEVRNYYQDVFLPEMAKRNAAPPPLQDVTARIESILVQQKIDALFDEWLASERPQVEMRIGITPQLGKAREAKP